MNPEPPELDPVETAWALGEPVPEADSARLRARAAADPAFGAAVAATRAQADDLAAAFAAEPVPALRPAAVRRVPWTAVGTAVAATAAAAFALVLGLPRAGEAPSPATASSGIPEPSDAPSVAGSPAIAPSGLAGLPAGFVAAHLSPTAHPEDAPEPPAQLAFAAQLAASGMPDAAVAELSAWMAGALGEPAGEIGPAPWDPSRRVLRIAASADAEVRFDPATVRAWRPLARWGGETPYVAVYEIIPARADAPAGIELVDDGAALPVRAHAAGSPGTPAWRVATAAAGAGLLLLGDPAAADFDWSALDAFARDASTPDAPPAWLAPLRR